jgi:hypothetical protein
MRALRENDPSLRVRCNFDTGMLWNETQITELADKRWDLPTSNRPVQTHSRRRLDWVLKKIMYLLDRPRYDTVFPLPRVYELMEENILREPSHEEAENNTLANPV